MTSAPDELRTVTTTATGTATGVPDLLTVQVGIATEGRSAGDVLADNNARTSTLIGALKAAGIAPADLATTSVDLGPRYDANGRIDGFRAENTLQVKLRDLDTAGAHLDTVVRIGGNDARVHGVSLGFADADALHSAARADAVRRARAQAEELAAAAGAQVGPVRSITDAVAGDGPMPFATTKLALAAAPMPIEAGTQDVTVQVQVVFDLR